MTSIAEELRQARNNSVLREQTKFIEKSKKQSESKQQIYKEITDFFNTDIWKEAVKTAISDIDNSKTWANSSGVNITAISVHTGYTPKTGQYNRIFHTESKEHSLGIYLAKGALSSKDYGLYVDGMMSWQSEQKDNLILRELRYWFLSNGFYISNDRGSSFLAVLP